MTQGRWEHRLRREEELCCTLQRASWRLPTGDNFCVQGQAVAWPTAFDTSCWLRGCTGCGGALHPLSAEWPQGTLYQGAARQCVFSFALAQGGFLWTCPAPQPHVANGIVRALHFWKHHDFFSVSQKQILTIRNVSRKPIWYSIFLRQNVNKMVSMSKCSWLPGRWAKGVFYSIFPCSEHNRVREFATLVSWSPPKISSCIFHPPENFERENRPTFPFFFFSASCAWSHAAPWATTEQVSCYLSPASQRVSYVDVRAPRIAMGLTAPAPPLVGLCVSRTPISAQPGAFIPAPVMMQQCWDPSLYVAAWSLVLSPAPSPLAPDRSPWVVPGPGSSLSVSGAVDGPCYSLCLCPLWPDSVGRHPLVRAQPALEWQSGPSSSPFGDSCPSPRSSRN